LIGQLFDPGALLPGKNSWVAIK